MRNLFEHTVTFISPSDPVARKKQAGKRPAAEILSTFADGALKQLGQSSVELRWYNRKEFVEPNEAQKEKLKGWAATQPDNRKNKVAAAKTAGGKTKKGGQKTLGALTPGSKKFKKYVRSEISALKAGVVFFFKSKDKVDEHNAIVAAIKALASTTAATTAVVRSAHGKTIMIQEPEDTKTAEIKAAEAAEVQLRSILKGGSLASKTWPNHPPMLRYSSPMVAL